MRNFLSKHAAGAILCLATVVSSPAALANIMTFNITWSSDSSASAYASITMDSDLINVGNGVPATLSMDNIQSLTVTVQGAQAGNGTFGKSDFSGVRFYSFAAMDFSHDLIGQNAGGKWSLPFGTLDALGSAGDFNLFGSSATAPVGVAAFTMVTNGVNDYAEILTIKSIIASGGPVPSPVPEPSGYALLLAGMGMLALQARRKA